METETLIDNTLTFEVESELDNEGRDVRVKMIILSNKVAQMFGGFKINQLNLYGKTVFEWVKSSAANWPCEVVEYSQNDNVIELVRPCLGNEEITVVVFDDTPLLRHATLSVLVSEFLSNKQNVKKLKRGYIFKTEYVRSVPNIYAPEIKNELIEDFTMIRNIADYHKALAIMKNRIINFHLTKGVLMVDPNSVHIDAEVDIASGTIIEENNYLYGNTVVENDVVLQPNNVVKNSLIGKGAILCGAYIENAKINPGTIVERYEKIKL